MKKIKEQIKRLELYDLLSPFILIIVIPLCFVYRINKKIKGKKIVLISEDPMEASDNGYSLFKYLIKTDLKDNVYYAISYKSSQKNKIPSKHRIRFYSLKHWIYYLCADLNVSIHKASSPAPALFYLLQKHKIFNGNRMFLQHGITMNDVSYLHQEECNFTYFITAAHKEHEYIKENLGYDENVLRKLGFSRFDELSLDKDTKFYEKSIVIIPTWRSYLRNYTNEEFIETDFYVNWQKFLNSRKLDELVRQRNMKVYFYLHRNFLKYSELFDSSNNNIIICNSSKCSIQALIKSGSVLITDYSSVSFDFAFNGRPLIYFQFDEDDFYKKHLKRGYFDYRDDGFGPVVSTIEDLEYELERITENSLIVDDLYFLRGDVFFAYRDMNNSMRIYSLIKEHLTDD